MSGDGPAGRGPMTGQRSEGDVGPILRTWMAAVAPDRAPERLLEESFARTMVGSQLRVFPWHRRPVTHRASARSRFAGLALAAGAVTLALALTASVVFRPGQGPGGLPSPSPSPTPASPSPGVTPGPPASVRPFPSPVTVAPIAEIGVDLPMAWASDGSTIWLFTARSNLLRIDPLTNSIAANVRLDLATDAFQGLAGNSTGLWVTDWMSNEILRFDPQTLEPVTSVDTVALSKGVLVNGDTVWVASTRGGSVQRIDQKTNTITTNISVGPTGPSGPNWLARGLGSIWTSVPNTSSVVRINELTNAVQATIPISGRTTPCGGLAAGPTAVWVVTCEGSYAAQIDPATNTQVGEVDLGSSGSNPVLIGDRTWVAPDGPRIVRLDPVSHDIDQAVVPGTGLARGGDILVAAGSLWVMDWADNRVLRLPLDAFGA
jgi:hypothetical protein